MTYLLLPLAGLLVGAIASMAGIGGAIMLVPILLWMGFDNSLARGTSFVNVLVVAIASLVLYGAKGAIDLKSGIMVACGSVIGIILAHNFINPHITNEKVFKYFFAGLLVVMAVFVLLKK